MKVKAILTDYNGNSGEFEVHPDTVVVLENGQVKHILTSTRNQVVTVLDYDRTDDARMHYQSIMRDKNYDIAYPNTHEIVPNKVYVIHDDTEKGEDNPYGVGVYNNAAEQELLFRVYGPSIETAEHTATFLAEQHGWTITSIEEVDDGRSNT